MIGTLAVDGWAVTFGKVKVKVTWIYMAPSRETSKALGHGSHSVTCNYTNACLYLVSVSNETRDLGIIIDNKLNFNSHVSAVAHKAHVRASLILRTFVSRDIDILTKAFTTYVRPILEYCTPVWSPHTACNINKIESCQRWFTKRIKCLCGLDYS